MSKTKIAPSQHSQPSRKGKKAWRKNVDISEVQSGLDSLREEILQGGPITEKTDSELFALDTIGDENITKKFKVQKSLRADEILAKRSVIPAVGTRKRAGEENELGTGLTVAGKRRKLDWVSKAEVSRIKTSIQSGTQLKEIHTEDANRDLWAEAPPVTSTTTTLQTDYIPPIKLIVAPKTSSHAPMSMTASGKSIASHRKPKGGTSYNPSFAEWDDLLTKLGDTEIAAEKRRLETEALEAQRQAAIEAAAKDAIYQTDGESAWEGFETEEEGRERDEIARSSAKRPERKDAKQRRKAEKRREEERMNRHEGKMGDRKKMNADIEALKREQKKQRQLQLQPPTANADATAQDSDADDSEDQDDPKLRRRRFGKHFIPEKQLEVVLPDELQDSLRRLKPEGNLLGDRFRNLLVNGKVEYRKQLPPQRKKRVKYTEKWTHKDFRVEV